MGSLAGFRGLLGEYGLVAGKGAARLDELRRRLDAADGETIPREARVSIEMLFTQADALDERAKAVESEMLAWHGQNEASQRLAAAPGIGPITATALVAAVGDARQFASARHFAAWLGLTPRVRASGERQRIGRISKEGDRYLRTLLIHGARALVGLTKRPRAAVRPWLAALVARRPVPVSATAVAHKTARVVWAMLTRGEAYRSWRPAAS